MSDTTTTNTVPNQLLLRCLPMLYALGDAIGNGPVDPNRPDSLGSRCDLILDIKRYLESSSDASKDAWRQTDVQRVKVGDRFPFTGATGEVHAEVVSIDVEDDGPYTHFRAQFPGGSEMVQSERTTGRVWIVNQ